MKTGFLSPSKLGILPSRFCRATEACQRAKGAAVGRKLTCFCGFSGKRLHAKQALFARFFSVTLPQNGAQIRSACQEDGFLRLPFLGWGNGSQNKGSCRSLSKTWFLSPSKLSILPGRLPQSLGGLASPRARPNQVSVEGEVAGWRGIQGVTSDASGAARGAATVQSQV